MPPFVRYQQGPGWGHLFFGLVFLIIFVALVVWAVVYLTRSWDHAHRHAHGPGTPTTGPTPAGPPSEALRILDERFARGEIDAEEYTKRRDLIRGTA
jgi:putative membrane protein